MSEQVEWRVTWKDDTGTLHIGQDGAQSLFGLTAAKKLAQKLGPPWQVRHVNSLLTPDEHAIQAASEAQAQQEPRFGGNWAP